MATPRELPAEFSGVVFTRAEAVAAGVTPAMLRGRRFQSVGHGLFRYAAEALTLPDAIRSAMRLFPDGAVSHTSSLALLGLTMRPMLPVHLATNRLHQVRRCDLVVHRHRGPFEPRLRNGIPVLGPERTFVDCGTLLDLPELVAAGDWLVAHRFVRLDDLRDFTAASHLDGVQRARVAAELVRPGAESVRESMARFHLVAYGLPEPAMNVDLVDESGAFLARGDMPYPEWMVLAEYDGWYHERDAAQRQHDVLRRERLEAAGWTVVVLTSVDLASPQRMVWRVYRALRHRGYDGPRPRLNPRFARWMRSVPWIR